MTPDLPAFLDAVRLGVAAAVPRAGVFARQVLVLEHTGSTNDDVARAAMTGAPEGYTVIAAQQTAGRGRRGASWHSPAGAGLYLSTLLRPEKWPSLRLDSASPAPSLVTLMAGVAVVSALHDLGASGAELKWPNDVMVRTFEGRAGSPRRPRAGASERRSYRPESSLESGASDCSSDVPWRKLAGILAEGASDAGGLRTVVLGIGINVHRSDAPDDVAARMVALDELVAPGDRVDALRVRHLVAVLLERVREGHDLLARGASEEIVQRWRAVAPSVDGTPVCWHHQGVMHRGRAAGVDATGALRVRTDDGRGLVVHGGDVEWLLEGQAP